MRAAPDAAAIAALIGRFGVRGRLARCEALPGGHIHASFRVDVDDGAARESYLLQQINTAVFREPVRLMENIRLVTEHLAREAPDGRHALRLARAPAAQSPPYSVRDAAGGWWRMFAFITDAHSFAAPRAPGDARRAAAAFGAFQRRLADLPPQRLHETLPGFHDTPARFAALDRAVAADRGGRLRDVHAELAALAARRSSAGLLHELHGAGAIPARVVHNDAKLSNVLFDAATDEALCVIDLDTVMPGLALHDFGDLVRSLSCPAAEDERDLARVRVEPELFAAIAGGYLGEAGAILSAAERAHLFEAGQIIVLEQAVRFLTDHLDGDRYYRTQRAGQNLDRARAQITLLESLERSAADLRGVLAAGGATA